MSYTHLSSKERYVISYLVLYGLSLREISRRLNRHHSTISRDILGDGSKKGDGVEIARFVFVF